MDERRASDRITQLDIESMIIGEPDPKNRTFLIVMNAINNSLIANTRTIKDVAEGLETLTKEFDEHAEAEEAIMNKGRGAWRLAAFVLAIAQAVIVWQWNDLHTSLDKFSQEVVRLTAADAAHDTRISVLEHKVK